MLIRCPHDCSRHTISRTRWFLCTKYSFKCVNVFTGVNTVINDSSTSCAIMRTCDLTLESPSRSAIGSTSSVIVFAGAAVLVRVKYATCQEELARLFDTERIEFKVVHLARVHYILFTYCSRLFSLFKAQSLTRVSTAHMAAWEVFILLSLMLIARAVTDWWISSGYHNHNNLIKMARNTDC